MDRANLESQVESTTESPSDQASAAEVNSAASPEAESKHHVSDGAENAETPRPKRHKIPFIAIWTRLRENRREVSAAIVLAVMAILWFDLSGAGSGDASSVADPLEGYDAVLSEFESPQDSEKLRDSAEPQETTSQTVIGSNSLYIPHYDESLSPTGSPGRISESAPGAAARYSNETPAFNSSPVHSPNQPEHRKVKFAGRIQPVN